MVRLQLQRLSSGCTVDKINFPTKTTMTGDGSDTTLTINSGRTVDDVLVFVNGICLVPTDDYTISGTTLTLYQHQQMILKLL